MNKLKAIKIIVGILTFLLVFLMLSAIGVIIKKTKQADVIKTKQVLLNQPKGSNIKQMMVNNKKLFLLIENGGLENRIVILDENNNITSEIYLNEVSNGS